MQHALTIQRVTTYQYSVTVLGSSVVGGLDKIPYLGFNMLKIVHLKFLVVIAHTT